jgi:hypothetical protein
MTQYSYQPTLNDSEVIALMAAMTHYLHHCIEKTLDGSSAPYLAHMRTLPKVMQKLSTPGGTVSTFIPPGKHPGAKE